MANSGRMASGRALVSIVLIATFALLSTGSAGAEDHRAPRARLVHDPGQTGRYLYDDWVLRRRDGSCYREGGDNFLGFPASIRVERGERVRIRLKKDDPPIEWALEAWTEVNASGQPEGDPLQVAAGLTPHPPAKDIVAWDLNFLPPPTANHLYLRLQAFWTDDEGCVPPPDLGSQSAGWTFHVRIA